MGHRTAHFSFHLSSSGGDFIPRKVRVSAMLEKHEKKKQRFRLLLWAGFELQNRTFSAECIQVSAGNVLIDSQYPSKSLIFISKLVAFYTLITLNLNVIICSCINTVRPLCTQPSCFTRS